MVILAAVMMGVVLPILPVQILWINMSTALLLGLMLAFESKEAGIMTRPPRNPNSPILNRVLLTRIFLVGSLLLISAFGLFQFELMLGATIEQARTVAVGVFVVTELFYLFNCRSLTKSVFKMSFFSNPWVLGGVTIMMILQLLFTYLPVMNLFFDSAPISLAAWGRIFAVSIITFFIIVFEKYLREKFK